jgi:hypothetical protein
MLDWLWFVVDVDQQRPSAVFPAFSLSMGRTGATHERF